MATPNGFKELLASATERLEQVAGPEQLEALRTEYLGRKGSLTSALRAISELPENQRKRAGQEGNRVKQELELRFKEATQALTGSKRTEPVDPTLPGTPYPLGHAHPVSLVLEEVQEVFARLGFSLVEGPEVEDDWHNFEALNMGPEHPARDMQDTFYVAGSQNKDGVYGILPRTHTSGVQIRTMEGRKPPLRIISTGKVYRNETEDATHSAVFHQVEGLMVDETTSFADLKGIMTEAVRAILGPECALRFRPSFFPYTEPSAEIDVSSPDLRNGEWLELAGSGMVHPQVLRNVGIDPKRYQGFAFGFGVERIAMLKYGVEDLRTFFKPDVRILEQF